MRRFGVILLLLFEAVWLNAFLPGRMRGVVKLADGGGCCGEGYESTKYSATMTILVPAICPCCGE